MTGTLRNNKIPFRGVRIAFFTALLVLSFATHNQAQNRGGSNTKPDSGRRPLNPANLLQRILANRQPPGGSTVPTNPGQSPTSQDPAGTGPTTPGTAVPDPQGSKPPVISPTNIRTPIPDPTNTNGSSQPGVNNSVPPGKQGSNNSTPGSPSQTPARVEDVNTNKIENTNAAAPAAPSQPDRGFPFDSLLVIVVAAIVVALIVLAAILYKLNGPKIGPGEPPGTTGGTENIVTPPPTAVKVQPSVDTKPQLEIEGDELPSLNTGISVKLNLDPGTASEE
jgi:hypothetical protein